MVAAVARQECHLELRRFHHELEAHYLDVELARSFEVAHLDYYMADSIGNYHRR